MIDLTKCQLIVMAVPDGRVDWKTAGYFIEKGLPYQHLLVIKRPHTIIENRNYVVEKYVLTRAKSFEWFIFADQDIWPTQLTEPFFDDVEAGIVGCQYDVGPQAWVLPDQFHMGLVRMRADVFQNIGPPWFQFQYNDNATQITKCECNYFRDKVNEKGVTITRRGYADHDSKHTWHR